MSVSLVRSQTGNLLFFFLQRNSLTDLKASVRRSTDEGKTWSEATLITPEGGYHVMNNARIIQLQSGRLLAPISTSSRVGTKNDDFKTGVYHSDDDGRLAARVESERGMDASREDRARGESRRPAHASRGHDFVRRGPDVE